jgi:hypothetical protein
LIYRSFNVEKFSEVLRNYPDLVLPRFDAEEWVSNPDNILLTDGEGNYGMFHFLSEGVYEVHQFLTSRGKEAVNFCREGLDTFDIVVSPKVLIGLTPDVKPEAKWMARRMGFTSLGPIDTNNGRCEFFVSLKENKE